jgi:membrane protein
MERLRQFFAHGLWRDDLRRMGFARRVVFAVLRIVTHTFVHWNRHGIGIRASGVTLVTLLSLVPLLALAFGIAQGLGYADDLDRMIVENTRDQPQHVREVVERLRELVGRTSFQALGWAATLVLAWSGLALFSRIEQALNLAWRTERSRGWLRRASDFIALVIVVPVLSLAALVTSSALHGLRWVEDLRTDWPWLGALYDAGLGAVPHAMLWLAFAALYKFMPSARVTWRAAIVGGIVAGSSLLFMHGIYLQFQVGVARANAIYATLAALPLLLVYLQLAWTIVLLGAELGYAVQNVHLIGPGRSVQDLSYAVQERLALELTAVACERFMAGHGPTRLAQVATELDVPREWLDAIAARLCEARVLAPVRGGKVTPARPCAQIGAELVREAMRGRCPTALAERLTAAEAAFGTGLDPRSSRPPKLPRNQEVEST